MTIQKNKKNILYVDNEEESLMSFKAVFRRDYNIFTTVQPLMVPLMIYKHDIDVLVSDLAIASVSGIDLFAFVKKENYNILRILVTGSMMDEKKEYLLKNDIIHAWVEKPWDKDNLEQIISTYLYTDKYKQVPIGKHSIQS